MASLSLILLPIKLFIAVIFAAWVCLWVMKPTQIWKKSWHTAENSAKGMFIGLSGLNIAVFSYPILIIAMLGYLYLHLLSEERKKRKQRRTCSILKLSNPIIIHKSIGIVSAGELLTAATFTVLLVWTFYSNISTDLNKMKSLKTMHLERWQFKVMRIGVRFGSLAEICLAVLFLPVMRGMALFKVIGFEFEASVRYHVWIGTALVLFAAIHGTTIMSIWAARHCLWAETTKWQSTGRVNLAGFIALVTALIIWITSFPALRRKHFQLFFSTHHLYMVFIIFFLFHGGDRHFYLVLPGILLLTLDKVLRIMQSRPTTSVISANLLPCKAIMLTISKHRSLKYGRTSMIFLNIPSISTLQWHPFSIISSSDIDSERMSVIIKSQGWWTTTLHNRVQSILDSRTDSIKSFQIAVEGPYGPSGNIFQRYDNLALIAGGSGITPFLSFLYEVASGKGHLTWNPSRVQVIYAVKKLEDLSMLTPLLSLLLNRSTLPNQLQLRAFVTQEERPSETATVKEIMQEMPQVRTVTFDQTSTVTTSQTPGGLVLKIVITGTSAIIFLLSVVILTHAFLPPPEKQSSESKTPSWITDLIVIGSFALALGFSVVIAVISTWWKSKNGSLRGAVTHGRQEKGLEFSTREVVVNRGTSTATATEDEHVIYFGRRPNITELLAEFSEQPGGGGGGRDVGVFVCGPDSMQESVADACRDYSIRSSGDDSCNRYHHKRTFDFHSIKFSL